MFSDHAQGCNTDIGDVVLHIPIIPLIANLLLMVIQKRTKRTWSVSGQATMIRIMLMYYVNCYTFLEEPEKDWAKMMAEAKEKPPLLSLFE